MPGSQGHICLMAEPSIRTAGLGGKLGSRDGLYRNMLDMRVDRPFRSEPDVEERVSTASERHSDLLPDSDPLSIDLGLEPVPLGRRSGPARYDPQRQRALPV